MDADFWSILVDAVQQELKQHIYLINAPACFRLTIFHEKLLPEVKTARRFAG
jgi:hypothetical protein